MRLYSRFIEITDSSAEIILTLAKDRWLQVMLWLMHSAGVLQLERRRILFLCVKQRHIYYGDKTKVRKSVIGKGSFYGFLNRTRTSALWPWSSILWTKSSFFTSDGKYCWLKHFSLNFENGRPRPFYGCRYLFQTKVWTSNCSWTGFRGTKNSKTIQCYCIRCVHFRKYWRVVNDEL